MRKRNKHISVWMNEQEYTHLKQQAARSGLGIDPFIRNLVQRHSDLRKATRTVCRHASRIVCNRE